MHIGAGRILLHLPESQGLKSRRQAARSLTARIHRRFNVAVAEEDDNQLWQRLTLLVCAVSSDADYAGELIARVVAFIEETRPDLVVLDCQVELLSGV